MKSRNPALPGGGGSLRHFTTLFAYDFDLGLGSTKKNVNIFQYILIFLIALNVVTKSINNVFQTASMFNKYPKIHVHSFKTLDPNYQ